MTSPNTPSKKQKSGLINHNKVRVVTFSVIVICILISVMSCILAVWDFTNQDSLWRTIATCVITGAGMVAFGIVNTVYGKEE